MKYYLKLSATAWKSAFTKRATFFVEVGAMFINNILFFILWWVFFKTFPRVGTWSFSDIAILYSIMSLAYGISSALLGGVRLLIPMIAYGEIDHLLMQPKNPLFTILLSKAYPKGLGDILSAFFYIIVGRIYSPKTLFLVFLFSVLSAAIITCFRVAMAALAFWFKNFEEMAEKYTDCVIIFSLYPLNIYPSFFRFFLFTIFPAGLIGFLPVELIKAFSWGNFALLIGCSSLFICSTYSLFFRGLRRYESGYSF